MVNILTLDGNSVDSKLPSVKPRFRTQFCISGDKIDYRDLSKVAVNAKANHFVPKLFSNDPDTKIVDYIGLYAIGLIELVFLDCYKIDETDTQRTIIEFQNNVIDNLFNNLIDLTEADKIFSIISNLGQEISDYNEPFTLYFMMRTHYDKPCHEAMKKFMDWLMVAWLKNPRIFWKVFFDIMETTKYLILPIFAKYVFYTNGIAVVDQYGFDKSDTEFKAIEYIIPKTDKVRSITDCRGLSILMCISMYYRMCYKYGIDNSIEPFIKHDDIGLISEIDKKIIGCIGNDDQYKALKGIALKELINFSINNVLCYTQPSNTKFTDNDVLMSRQFYEERILFMKRYGINEMKNGLNVNVHYSNIFNIIKAVSELLYMTLDIDTVKDMHEEQIVQIESERDKALRDVEYYKNKISELEKKHKEELSKEEEKYIQQINNLNSIVDNKNNSIDLLVEKNANLNKQLDEIYCDETEELEDETFEISIEEMVKMLNDFKILLVGGRMDLRSKLNEYGLTNVEQVDRANLCTGIDVARYADFCVINTRFISHTLAKKVENVTDSERRMSYNGTNPEKLIISLYDFVQKYFNTK